MKIIKTYSVSCLGNFQRKQTEKKLFKKGFKIIEEEEFKKRGLSGCVILILLIVFFPLVLLALVKIKFIKVVYEN